MMQAGITNHVLSKRRLLQKSPQLVPPPEGTINGLMSYLIWSLRGWALAVCAVLHMLPSRPPLCVDDLGFPARAPEFPFHGGFFAASCSLGI
jgi:hypothetical protein